MEQITAGIDLDALDQRTDAVHDVQVQFDEDGNATAGFMVVDANSQRYRDAKRKFDVANVKRGAVRRKAIDAKTDDGASTLLDMGEEQARVVAIACVDSWYGFKVNGTPAPLNPTNLGKVFTAFPQWVELVNRKIVEGASFLASSATSSAPSQSSSSASTSEARTA